jgi:homoserine dehydrogenase
MKLGIIGIGKVGSQFLTDIQYMNQFSEITVILMYMLEIIKIWQMRILSL